MGTMSSCLKKIGLSEHEAAILRGATGDNIKDGDAAHIAAVRAVSDFIEQLEAERASVVKQIDGKGGKATDAPFKLADLADLLGVLKKHNAPIEIASQSPTMGATGNEGAGNANSLPSGTVPGTASQRDGATAAAGDGNRQSLGAGLVEDSQSTDPVRGVPGSPEAAGSGGTESVQPDGSAAPGPARDLRTVRLHADAAAANGSVDSDFEIDADEIGKGGLTKKYKDNIAAIRVIKALEAEDRKATAEERKTIAKYVGWGAMKNVFDPASQTWAKEYAELKALFTEAEFKAARKSALNAHYTSPIAISAMYRALERIGFAGGRMLEPSVGVGNFFGLMPRDMRAASDLHGVELDALTSKIVDALYPKAKIAKATGFQDYAVPSGFFDVVIGNPPFGNEPIVDMDRSPYSGFSIHNYFLAKSIDKLRPGGVMPIVVSHSFLDAMDERARKWIWERAALIGAVRLPNTAFKANAGTEVVTDILVFQKRDAVNGLPNDIGEWRGVVEQQNINPKTGESVTHRVSRLFAENPQLVLGKPSAGGSQYNANEYTIEPTGDLAEQLNAWVDTLPQGAYTPIERAHNKSVVDMAIPDGVKPGSYFVGADGEVLQRGEDVMGERTATPWSPKNAKAAERMAGMIGIRDLLRAQMRLERSLDASNAAIEANRAELNKQYDAFLKEHGHLNSQVNRAIFLDDTEAQLVQALEFDYDKGISKAVAEREEIDQRAPEADKADIFKRRVAFPPSDHMKVETAKDALLASLNYRGKMDQSYMEEVYGKPMQEMIADLGDVVFEDPSAGWTTADGYLSGDVKTKLEDAKAAAMDDARFARNVEALEKVIPADKRPSEISVNIGAAFVPAEIYQDFVRHITGAGAALAHVKAIGMWVIEFAGTPDASLNSGRFGTSDLSAQELFKLTLLGRGAVVKKIIRNMDGSTTTVLLEKETEAAREKQSAIKNEWQSWIWKDAGRANQIVSIYNDKMNRIVERKFDGAHLTFPGMNPAITLLDHQKNGVWRALQSYQVLYDQVVGSGKTFEMTTAAMEMRRLGISRKPLFVVPNHLTLQWRSEFTRLYPGSNILAAAPEDFSKDNRGRLFSKIVTGDWDAVVIGHSSLKKIGLPIETETAIVQEQIDEVSDAVEEMKRNRGDRNIIRDMEKIRSTLEAKMKDKLAAIGKRDKVVTFDELGIDAMFVDEMHEYKNLSYNSTMDRNPGMGNPAGSAKAFDMFVKVRWLFDTFGEKTPFITATGTPVSNSLVEMFNMQRYMQYPTLKADGLHVFDSWAKQFGNVESVYEVAPSGTGYRQSTRFSKFSNLPALMNLYNTFADTVTLDDLKAQEAAQGKRFPVPKLVSGGPVNIVAKRSPLVANFMGVPMAELDEAGNVSFGLPVNADLLPMVEQDQETGKWKALVQVTAEDGNITMANLGSYETREDAELKIVEKAITPVVTVDPESILGQFGNLKQLMKDSKGKINALSLTNLANKAGLDFRLINPAAPDFAGSKINLAVTEMLRVYEQWKADKGAQLVFCDMSIPLSAKKSYASKERRLYVRDQYGQLEMKRGTLHVVPGFEWLPHFVVQRGTKDAKRFDIYDATTGVVVHGGYSSRAEANAEAEALLSETRSRESWMETRGEFGEISGEEIDAFNDANEIDTNELAIFSKEDVQGASGAGGFSVYDDIKSKLIAKGIPEREIAFIHDFATPTAKAKLFAAVNNGDIRFLLGSTPKMGAGTNVQKRLVGLHHIDAPWRPSDLEQREGRIIRRGNELYERDPDGFEVFIGRYATEQTYDTRRWQILEHKARGIEQLRNFDGTINEIDDIDGEASNAADMKAAASGDPLILEETKLRNEVIRLERLQASHADEQMAMMQRSERSLFYAQETGPKTVAHVRQMMAAVEGTPSGKKDDFKAAIAGENFTDIEAFTKRLSFMFDALMVVASSPFAVRFRGQKFSFGNSFGSRVRVDSELDLMDSWGPQEVFSPSGFITRMQNFIERLPAVEADTLAKTEKALIEAGSLKRQAAQPFQLVNELDAARAGHTGIRRQLMAKGPSVPDAQKPIVAASIEKQKQRLIDIGLGDAVKELFASRAPIYSREEGAKLPKSEWLPTGQIVDQVTELLKQFKAEIPVTIIDNEGDVLPANPAGDNDIAAPEWATSGFVYRGRIHLVREGLDKVESVAGTLFHELLHYGIRRFVPEEQYIAEMHSLYMADPWIRRETKNWLNSTEGQEFYVNNGKDAEIAAARGVDEALAKLAEELHNERVRPGVTIGDRLASVVRNVLEWLGNLASKFAFGVVKERIKALEPGQQSKDYVESIFKRLREGDAPFNMTSKWAYADPAFHKVWHGSPHDHDKFDNSHPDTLFSKDAKATNVAPSEIRAALAGRFGEKGIKALEQSGMLKIMRLKDAPEAIRAEAEAQGASALYTADGVAYLFSDRMTADEAPGKLLHEIGEHHGLERMLGSDGWGRMKKRIATMAKAKGSVAYGAWQGVKAKYGEFSGMSNEQLAGNDRFLHEVLAAIGENKAGLSTNLWRELLATVKEWLASKGFLADWINEGDIANLVAGSLKKVMREAESGLVAPQTMDAIATDYFKQIISAMKTANQLIEDCA